MGATRRALRVPRKRPPQNVSLLVLPGGDQKRDGNDPDVIYFPTDLVLMDDPGFKPHFDEFARNQAAFFTAYADAHRRLSELGSKFEPEKGITGV